MGKLGTNCRDIWFFRRGFSKAIFSFSATRPYEENEIEKANSDWLSGLKKTLSDPLGKLIDSCRTAVIENKEVSIKDLDIVIEKLKNASKIRNAICHGSWRLPDTNGASIPFFFDYGNCIFETPIDCLFLKQLQSHTADIACSVINTVTHLGW
ncbi:MAG: hypothetical protein O2966_02295 [Proteobacteria bacterium]|nr:hypothetical protein [Pseudomonadota bacterium]